MKITVELGGGLESVFENNKKFDVEIESEKATAKELIQVMAKNFLKGNPDYFIEKTSL